MGRVANENILESITVHDRTSSYTTAHYSIVWFTIVLYNIA